MRWLASTLVFFVGCAHAPPPPPKVEKPIADISDISGSWTSSNEVDWGYFLTIDKDGNLNLDIERGRMGRCEQTGKLAKGADAKSFATVFTKNECDRDHAGVKLEIKVVSYTGDDLELAITGDGVHDRRTYQRNKSVK